MVFPQPEEKPAGFLLDVDMQFVTDKRVHFIVQIGDAFPDTVSWHCLLYTSYNESMINWEELKNFGLSREYLMERGLLDQMLKGYKTNQVVPILSLIHI